MRILKTKASLSKKMIWMELPASMILYRNRLSIYEESENEGDSFEENGMDGDTASLCYLLTA